MRCAVRTPYCLFNSLCASFTLLASPLRARKKSSSRSRQLAGSRSPRSNRIVPGRANGVVLEVERGHLGVGDLLTGWILVRLKNCAHCETAPRLGATDEPQNGVPGSSV